MNHLHRHVAAYLLLIVVVPFIAHAVDAPYLTGVMQNGNRLVVSWRNNDISTEKFLLLRKTSEISFACIDTLSGSVAQYTDADIAPATIYYYALIALVQNTASDTSNTGSAMSAPADGSLVIPPVAVFWDAVRGTDSIAYYDSCMVESGFRLYRRGASGDYAMILTRESTDPASKGWRFFLDGSVSPDSWYEYKVEVYDNNESVFSNDSMVYTYREPPVSHGYAFSKIAEFPVNPSGWSEIAGDSLYVVEKAADSSEVIAVIDITDEGHPSFKGYLKPDSLPASLRKTKIGRLAEFGITRNSPWEQRLFFAGRYGFYFNAGTLVQYDTATGAGIDTMVFPGPSGCDFDVEGMCDHFGIAGCLNDSLLLVDVAIDLYYGETVYSTAHVENRQFLCKFSASGIDTAGSVPLGSFQWSSGMYYTSWHAAGLSGSKYYFRTTSGHPVSAGFTTTLFQVLDYSMSGAPPRRFQIKQPLTFPVASAQIDESIAAGCMPFENSLQLMSFDVRNVSSTSITRFSDTSFKGGMDVKNIIVDTAGGRIFVVTEKSVAYYRYERTAVGAKGGLVPARARLRGTLSFQHTTGGILVNVGPDPQRIVGLYIYDLAGRLVRRFTAAHCSGSGMVLWNNKNDAGLTVASGSYFVVLKRPDGVISGKTVISR